MLFYLVFVFQFFHSISSSISCYDAPSDKNTFNYIITPDNSPSELRDSSLVTNSLMCAIQVEWKRGLESTKIALIAERSEQPVPSEHSLQAEVGYIAEGAISIWEQVIIYQCHTDRCNSLNQLKRLLSSLTINDDLAALTALLVPVAPFQGQWCSRFSNSTFYPCNTTVANNSCTRCQLIGRMDQTEIELCATCSIEESERSGIGYEIIFNLTSRTSFSNWMIICERDGCNAPAIGERIRQKSYIDLDYEKFFRNRTGRLQITKMLLLFIGLLIKNF